MDFEQWLNSPLILTAGIAVIGVLITIGIWIGSVNSDRKSFKEFMKEVREDIKKILQRLPPPPISTGSPLRLTDYGKKLAEESNADQIIDRLCESGELAKKVEGKSPYEIQEFCFKHMQEEVDLTDSEIRTIQRCAFENGTSYEDMGRVLGIVLRDKLLQFKGKTEGE